MGQRTCDVAGCGRKHLAKGLCASHYSARRRADLASEGRSHHTYHERTCVTCGAKWMTPRPEARFCTAKCKGVHLALANLKTCRLPAEHPVMLLIAEARKPTARPAPYAWRKGIECPACGCWFTPLWTPTAICCSKKCSRRMGKRRRRARENNTLNDWRWSDFMRVARRFGYRCAYCGEGRGQLEPDHVVPLSRGGLDAICNLLPTCHQCNADKNARTPDEWEQWRRERGKPDRATRWAASDPRYAHLTSSPAA